MRVVITGAGSGLGAAAARLLASRHAHVVCADVSGETAGAVATEIGERGGRAFAVQVDVSSWESVQALAETAAAGLGGPPNGVVQCAGVSEYGRAEDLDVAIWRRVIDINLTGTWHVMKAFLPQLRKGGGASVVNVSTVAGLKGTPLSAAYAASKAGVIGLTRQVAIDYGQHGIRANAICPGTVLTPMVLRGYRIKGGDDDEAVERQMAQAKKRFPLGRLGEVADVGELISFLVGPRSGWITGAVIPVDGGFSAVGWLPDPAGSMDTPHKIDL